MQKGKGVRYSVAGLQMTPGMAMNVRRNVYIPDSEACESNMQDRRPFRADGVEISQHREPLSLSYRVAIPFLLMLLLIFSGLIAGRLVAKVNLVKTCRETSEQIISLNQSNQELQKQAAAITSYAAISYKAQTYGLISIHGVESVPVVAPDTRPVQSNTVLLGS